MTEFQKVNKYKSDFDGMCAGIMYKIIRRVYQPISTTACCGSYITEDTFKAIQRLEVSKAEYNNIVFENITDHKLKKFVILHRKRKL